MKKPVKICFNPQCEEEIKDYASARKKFCCAKCKSSYHNNKKMEDEEESITNARAINRLKRFLKEMLELEIESFKFKSESYFFNNTVLPSKQILIKDNGEKLYVIKFDNIIINIDENTNQLKIIKNERTNKTFY